MRDETLKRHSQSDITKLGWFTEKVLLMVREEFGGVTSAEILLISVMRELNFRSQWGDQTFGCAPEFPSLIPKPT